MRENGLVLSRIWLITDVHLGVDKPRKRGTFASPYLRACFRAANETLESDFPVTAVLDLGDRGNRKHDGVTPGFVQCPKNILDDTQSYAQILTELDDRILYDAVQGNHDTDPGYRVKMIAAMTGRNMREQSHTLSFGAVDINLFNFDIYCVNEHKDNKRPLTLSSADIAEIERVYTGNQGRPFIDVSHVPLCPIYSMVIDREMKRDIGNGKTRSVNDVREKTEFGTYFFDNAEKRLALVREFGIANIASFYGHIHDPYVIKGKHHNTGDHIGLPSFSYPNKKKPDQPSAVLTELVIDDEKKRVSANCFSINRSGKMTAPKLHLPKPFRGGMTWAFE